MSQKLLMAVFVLATLLAFSLNSANGCTLNTEETASDRTEETSTDSTEKDYEETALSEGRKDWLLAIEKSREFLAKSQPGVEFRLADLDDEVMENELHQYRLVFRSENKSCVIITVKQAAEDKFTVEESGGSNESSVCTVGDN